MARLPEPLGRRLRYGTDGWRRTFYGARAACGGAQLARRVGLARSLRRTGRGAVRAELGYAVFDTPPFDTSELVARAEQALDGRPVDQETFRVHVDTACLADEHLDADSPFVRAAIAEPLVVAAARYLGVVPVVWSIELWRSRWVPEPLGSMHWHRDWDDVRQMKAYISVSDVGPGDGPMVVIPAAESERAAAELKYSFEGDSDSYLISDETLAEVVSLDRAVALTRPKGGVSLVDTSTCFHHGSRITAPRSRRDVLVVQYVRPGSFRWAPRLTGAAPFAHLVDAGRHTTLERLVLGASR